MKEIGTKTKYSKIQQMMSLPDKRPLDKTKQIIFEKTPITQQQSLYVNASILRKRNDLIDQLQQQLELFTTTEYKFPFPESKFPNVPEGQRNNISYAQKVQVQEEDTFQNRLNDQQIQQIKQRGQFEVKSKAYNATIPYVWKINGCILRGRLKRILIFENGLAWCYNLMDTAVIKLKQLVPKGFRDFLNMPIKLFAIIFGKKQLSPLHQPDYSRQICKDFWTDIMNDELKDIQNEVGHEFLKLLYLPYEKEVYKYVDQGISGEERTLQQKNKNEKTKIYNQNITKIYQFKETIRRVETGFETHWLKIRKRILTKVSNESDEALNQKLISLQNDEQPLKQQVRKKDRAILERLYEQKFLIYTAHIRQNFKNQNINGNIIQTLMFLMLLFATIQRKILLKNEKLKQIQGGLRQKIDKKYPVRSKNKKFKERKFKKQYELIKQEIQAEFFDKLLIDVINKDNFNQKYQSIYAKYINLVKNFDKLVEQKKENLTSLYTPSRVFRTTYILFPPYQVVQTNSYFSLKRKQEMRIDTSSHFWKCSLYAMRLKSWTLNCFKFLLGVCWAGPLGFRSLFGIQNFKYDQDCNSQTGVKYEITRTPFLGRFCKVLRGIKKSRARFEGQPDRGLFGKNCSRICNYIECYIFRLLIVGVILVLMLYPVGIILFSIICLIGVLTAWIWVPLAMVLCYLFNIFIFQFQVSSSGEGCLIRSVPLLSLLIQIFFAIFKIIGPIIFLLIIAPLICVGYFLYLIVQRIVRTISDTVMLCLIGCFGRTPSRDSSIAKKISGPGLSRNYFFSIAEQDVYILTQAALQKIIANKYIQMTRKKIKQGTIKYNALTSTVLKPFGISQPNLNKKVDLINANNNELLNNFNKQAGYYLARYPSNPHGVRFTQQQIQLYFDNCVKIVKNFVKRQDAQGWIFQERGLLNEDYQELTRVIWTDIFNCGDEIFEPLQKIDNRFKLIDQEDDANNSNQMQKNVNSIMQALQGEVELNERKPNFTPIKRSLLERDYPINYIAQICELHTNNSETRINVNIQDPTCLLVCPRNLQQLKLYDIYQKEQLIRTHPKIIEK